MSKSIKTGEKFVHNSFLWYVSKRKREQSLLVTHSIPRVPVYYSNWGYTPTFLLNRNSIWLSKISNLVGHVVK